MQHLLSVNNLNLQQIKHIINRALAFKQGQAYANYPSSRLANLFYENSTRTRISFELAASHLSIPVVHLDLERSSEAKGESIEDTIKNLVAMGIDLFVIRHALDFLPQQLAEVLPENTHLLNAGDGKNQHPSQALLDLLTMLEYKRDLSRCKITIIGDVKHSRVANSLHDLLAIWGVKELCVVAPPQWQRPELQFATTTDSIAEGLKNADIIICLRVQRERLFDNDQLDMATYHRHFALTEKNLGWAKPDAIVMHPGPINRGIEIESVVADGDQSAILQQVKNGVYIRMAMIDFLLNPPA